MPFQQTNDRPANSLVRREIQRLVAVVALMTAAGGLLGAVIVLDAPIQTNGYWAYPVSISMGASENVAGLQFDIELDSSAVQFVDIEMGPAAIAGGKDVVFSMLDSDTVRVLVVGLNEEHLSAGVVANLYVTSLQQPSGAAYPQIGGLVVSDPLGNPVAPEAESGTEETSNEQFNRLTPATTQDVSAGATSERTPDSAAKSASTDSSGSLMGNILNALLGDDYAPVDSGSSASDSSRAAAGSAESGASSYAPDDGAPTVAASSQYLAPQTYIPGAAPRTEPARIPGAVSRRTSASVGQGAGASAESALGSGVMALGPAVGVAVPGSGALLVAATPDKRATARANEPDTTHNDNFANRWAIVPAAAVVCLLVMALWASRAPLIGLANRVLRPSSPERD